MSKDRDKDRGSGCYALVKVPVRLLKGLLMGALYLVFAFGIALELFIFIPAIALYSLWKGPDPRRLQAVHRFLLRIWLFLMAAGGLLVVESVKGQPPDRASVIIANHPGLFDVIVLICTIPEMTVMVKRSLVSWLPLGPIVRLCGYVLGPARDNPATGLDSVNEAVSQLQSGFHFMLFPEGSRSPKGSLSRFRPGALKIAGRAGAQIQPVVIHSNPPFMTHRDHWYMPPFKRSRVVLEFLPPLSPPESGEERKLAVDLEQQYRNLLNMT